MPQEKVTGLQSTKYGNEGIILDPPGWRVVGNLTVTARSALKRTIINDKVVVRRQRDQGLDTSFEVLIDTSKYPVKKKGEVVVIRTQLNGDVNFEVVDVNEIYMDGADGKFAYTLTADEGIDYISS